jgi:hypothetical protein
VAGPACQRPTTAHGCVSRPVRAHVCVVMLQWLGHRPPSHIGAVGQPPPPPLHAQPVQRLYLCVAATPRPHSPSLPRQPPSSHPTLLSSLFTSATAMPIADRASHRYCHRLRAPELRHHTVSLSAREAASLRDCATNHMGRFILHVEPVVDNRLRPS